MGGDTELLRKIARRFQESSPEVLSRIQEAIARNDPKALAFHAHLLKGMVGNFFAWPAREAALRLETLGHAGDLGVAGDAFAALEKEVERLREALAAVAEEAVAR